MADHTDSAGIPADDTPQPIGKGGAPAAKPKSELRDTAIFLLKLAIFVFIIRSFLISPFVIPSGSMLPRLLVGDYLFITKWNYGYSKHSLPFSLPLIPGRVFASTPERGDVAVFKAPPQDADDWIKRVIGVPGDTIQMSNGQIILNGQPVPKQRVADFVLPLTPNFNETNGCRGEFVSTDTDGTPICRVPQFRETLPNGKSYMVLDQGSFLPDDTETFTVPEGHAFMMGDNRDDSKDSRFQHLAGGIEFVPLENIQGKAVVNFWSTDGNAEWLMPWTWFTAARWERIGDGF